MYRLTLGTLIVVTILVLSEVSAFAQMGMPSMPGMGGVGGGTARRPQRKLKRNSSPVLSPALNMVPGVATSFEGQFLMRTLPQEQVNRNTSQFGKQIESLQNKTMQQDAEIKSGIGKTGHSSRFMNYGNYYSSGAGRRQ
jgi:hypothetical protein